MMKKPSKVGVVLASLPVILFFGILCIFYIESTLAGPQGIRFPLGFIGVPYLLGTLLLYGLFVVIRWICLPRKDVYRSWVRLLGVGSLGQFLVAIFQGLYQKMWGLSEIHWKLFLGQIGFLFFFSMLAPIIELVLYLKSNKYWKEHKVENTPAID